MLQNAVCDDILKKPSASGGIAPRPLPGALPLDPTGGLLWPPGPYIIFLLFHFSPVPCLSIILIHTVISLSSWVLLVCPFCFTLSPRCSGKEFVLRVADQDWILFSRSSYTCDLIIGIPVAALPGAWHYRVSAGTGLSVYCDWVRQFELHLLSRCGSTYIWADLSLRCCWEVK